MLCGCKIQHFDRERDFTVINAIKLTALIINNTKDTRDSIKARHHCLSSSGEVMIEDNNSHFLHTGAEFLFIPLLSKTYKN